MKPQIQAQQQIPPAITQIQYPAYMVSRDWNIDWINDQAEQLIFGRPVRKIECVEDRHFFKLLFQTSARELVTDFKAFVRSHLPLVQGDLPAPGQNRLLSALGHEPIQWLQQLWPDDVAKIPMVDSKEERIQFRGAPAASYHRIAVSFREGVLVIWIPSVVDLTPVLDLLAGRHNIITDLLLHKLPTLQTMAVLVADLQGSMKISAELPPEEYFELISQIWTRLELEFRTFHSTPGKHAGDGVLLYFLAKHDSAFQHIANALLCADRIRQTMLEINGVWKLKKHWLNELVLNIGLHEGREWIGRIPSLPASEVTALGDTVNIAARLSSIPRGGAIWSTKHFLSSLPVQILDYVGYGIRKRLDDGEHIVAKTYSRVRDLSHATQIPKCDDIADLPVTEILRLDAAAIHEILRSVSTTTI